MNLFKIFILIERWFEFWTDASGMPQSQTADKGKIDDNLKPSMVWFTPTLINFFPSLFNQNTTSVFILLCMYCTYMCLTKDSNETRIIVHVADFGSNFLKLDVPQQQKSVQSVRVQWPSNIRPCIGRFRHFEVKDNKSISFYWISEPFNEYTNWIVYSS